MNAVRFIAGTERLHMKIKLLTLILAPLCAITLQAGTPAQDKDFVDKYKAAFEKGDKATLESFLYTKDANPMALEFYKMMMTAEAGGKISKIELVDLTPEDVKKAIGGPNWPRRYQGAAPAQGDEETEDHGRDQGRQRQLVQFERKLRRGERRQIRHPGSRYREVVSRCAPLWLGRAGLEPPFLVQSLGRWLSPSISRSPSFTICSRAQHSPSLSGLARFHSDVLLEERSLKPRFFFRPA